MQEADYIIVGAGSAGCVLANRLSEDPGSSVLLIEAGGSDAHPFVRMPSAFSLPVTSPRFNWLFESEPQPGLGGRRLACPRGRVLGGSSSINGMVYVRGHPEDFQRWAALGAEGWSYADVLPYFRKAERLSGVALGSGASAYRGHEGPLTVTRGRKANPLYDALLEAAAAAGYGLSEDLNGYRQEAFGDFEMTVAGGVRMSTARAYLAPAKSRRNLRVARGGLATRVLFDGNGAAGVELRRGRQLSRLSARREVILAAGAIGSPQLLMLSGIGPEAELERHGIPLRQASPDVGANLMDHLELYFQQACTRPVSLNRHLGLISKGAIGARWLLDRGGLGATNHFEAGGFLRSAAGVPWPDIQMHFLPAAVRYDGKVAAPGDGFQLHLGPMQSPSRGRVRLQSADPTAAPSIDFNYMSDPEDWRVFRAALRFGRELFAQAPFDTYRGDELAPGPAADSDHAIDEFVRTHAESAYHPCGTCRMGTDAEAVVDPEGRVQGVPRLRVVDASIFPHITNGNLNAPTIMAAEKVAAAMTDCRLAPDPRPYYLDPEASRRQRGP